jgi:5'-AMP-activated protein kinase regulatory gamma subunit
MLHVTLLFHIITGVRSAPLWDSQLNKFVGMLTITDFINILRRYYKSPIVGMDELEEQTIQTWRESEKQVASVKSSLIQIDPEESLYEAVKVLIENKIHRLPIIDRRHGNALFIITHKRVLHYMYYTVRNNNIELIN